MPFAINHSVGGATAYLDRLAAGVAPATQALIADAIVATNDLAVASLQALSPEVSGKLKASIHAIPGPITPSGNGWTISTDISADAESEPNLDGSGGGYHYIQAVIEGRPAIIAPSSGPFSTGKKALRTPWGPRKSVKASQPNPFNERAVQEMQGPLEALLMEKSSGMLKVLASSV